MGNLSKSLSVLIVVFLMLFILVFGVQDVKFVKALDISFPSHSTYSTGSPLALSVSSDGLGASNIYYSMNYSVDGEGNVSIPLISQFGIQPFFVLVTGSSILPELPEGSYNITVFEEVRWSGRLFGSENATAYFTIDDGKPPIITNLSLENKTYSQNTLSLNFTTDEPTSWIGYSLDGHDNVTVTANTTLTDLSSQKHTLTVYAQDLAGNTGSETVNFAIFPTTLVLASIVVVTVIAIGAGLIVYVKKRKHQDFHCKN
jgi:hypothetical protein